MLALIRAFPAGDSTGQVVLVVSTSPGAPALALAEAEGIPTRLLPAEDFTDAAELDRALAAAFTETGVELVCLAGYLRLLGPAFLEQFPQRVTNIHPALLPAFGGKGFYGRRIHEAVLASGARYTGVTIHFVDDQYDHGPIIAQAPVPVEQDDTVETLAARVLEAEHRLYPETVRRIAAGQVRVEGGRVQWVGCRV